MTRGADDGRRVRWQEHNLARRTTIIDAAIAVVERQPAGEEISLQGVAETAGLSRTVIYRHFDDRADLDRAVQRALCARVGAVLLPALTMDGTPDQIVRRVVAAFVTWAEANPTLIAFAERDLPGWGPSPLHDAIESIADRVETVMENVVASLGVELDELDRAGLDPWVFGMVTAIFAAVRRWVARAERLPDTKRFIAILSESVWLQIDGLATTRGIVLPDLPISELLVPLGGDA